MVINVVGAQYDGRVVLRIVDPNRPTLGNLVDTNRVYVSSA